MSDLEKTVNSAAAGVGILARGAAKATRRMARTAKLNLVIADERKNINRLYTEVGRLYYEAHRDDPEGFFVNLFQKIDASMEAVAVMETELENLRNEIRPVDPPSDETPEEPDITVEIEEEPEAPGCGDADAEAPGAEPERGEPKTES